MKGEIVTTCRDCPFYSGASCSAGSKVNFYDYNMYNGFPDDCPLPIVVTRIDK